MAGCGVWCHGLLDTVAFGHWLGLMVSEAFSNLIYPMILRAARTVEIHAPG